MATEKRIKIITVSEVQEFYSPLLFTTSDQRFFFALDDREQEACKKVRPRRSRCMLTLLLGYSSVLSRLLDSFEHQDDLQKIEIAKQASPVACYNINLKGTYNFELSDDLPNLEGMMRSIDGYLPV
jgi:hypothetical protein